MKNLDTFKQQGDVIWDIANLLRGPYQYEAPRPLAEIEADIKDLEREIMTMLEEVTL